jgi:nitroimidazol reductase NimA-like FMN-containing flavoprotein (pyridoxamine 5'-phosphate oxidase superfamily)
MVKISIFEMDDDMISILPMQFGRFNGSLVAYNMEEGRFIDWLYSVGVAAYVRT